MGAPKNNRFWLNRTKHGRDSIFSDPDVLLNESLAYFEWCESNPMEKREVVRGGECSGMDISYDIPRPLTWWGLAVYLGIGKRTLFDYRKDEKYKDFLPVFSIIDDIITEQKVSHAMIGNYNANLVSRVDGHMDKQDITSGGEPIQKNIISFGGKEVEI